MDTIALVKGCSYYLLGNGKYFKHLTREEQRAMEEYFTRYSGSWANYTQMSIYVLRWLIKKQKRLMAE